MGRAAERHAEGALEEKEKEIKTIKAVEADEFVLAGEAANNGADEAVEDDLVTSVDNTDLISEVTTDVDFKCDFSSTSQKGLNTHRSAKHKEKNDQKSRVASISTEYEQNANTANLEEVKLIESKLEAYCHECDIIFRCKELLLYHNHCKVAHSWLCCDRNRNGEGCDYATSSKKDLRKHMLECYYI